ncbi:MAG TPA: hydrogenase subunit MbhD domain-containing protein [Acetobacteraceae bacterium]|nr:hydrogenase subunit MbhD domain-containing protein [Acetobacteraceae bacterium]
MALQLGSYILVAIGALMVVLTRRPERQVLVYSLYGLLLSLLFLVIRAPDVALSELAVGSVAIPLAILVTLSKMRDPERLQ